MPFTKEKRQEPEQKPETKKRRLEPETNAKWFELAKGKDPAIRLYTLSPQGGDAWSKKWAGRLEEELQKLYMPTSRKERRALHSKYGTNMEKKTSPGVVGVTVLLPKFFKLYPDVKFEFKQGRLAGTYYGHTAEDGKSCYLSTDKPKPKP
ncbi:hypothetical protein CHLRE_01g019400v5 [Chlamydomonas reinhardtii]|uniref:Uncharacterized protein n=1 Tax=Chlamydomonas reinhardtii TaxID=3055 RepID=A0A2K3E5Y8_CHLRE|nr:uncharacterized protein CHLRE_01g019400v5 [Chlamydomonas reinhardtii]PNW88211.1 hypothetical protein CHLRE_01g019400v5 [Chlamydomonas reinhardtii]